MDYRSDSYMWFYMWWFQERFQDFFLNFPFWTRLEPPNGELCFNSNVKAGVVETWSWH